MKKMKTLTSKYILFLHTINALILLNLYACKSEPQKQPAAPQQTTPPQETTPTPPPTTYNSTTTNTSTATDTTTNTANLRSANPNSNTPQSPQEIQQHLETQAKQAINALKNKNFAEFAHFAHPTKGIRWTPNFTIDLKTDQVTPANEIPDLLKKNKNKVWGYHAASGDPLEFSFAQYYMRYIYSHNFSEPTQLNYNKSSVKSNATNNHAKIYTTQQPETNFTEFYVKGTNPKYAGLDWGSLTLVWQKHTDNNWYIVNVIHGAWAV